MCDCYSCCDCGRENKDLNDICQCSIFPNLKIYGGFVIEVLEGIRDNKISLNKINPKNTISHLKLNLLIKELKK